MKFTGGPSTTYEDKRQLVARSKSLSNFGKSATEVKNGVIPTKDIWKGIHLTKDIIPSMSAEEHKMRVFNREYTPWSTKSQALQTVFAPVKDVFVQRSQPLLNKHKR